MRERSVLNRQIGRCTDWKRTESESRGNEKANKRSEEQRDTEKKIWDRKTKK